ncbi:COG4648 family protein [Pyxidicoccus xibeiensis]|uniref:COG4648 family protein n=1 Tax=Pyxidicoccus xibeiensis TaxID=2906759 RepID=UPI0020A76CC2|nr:hypothetical protein [Pyxidicoccus xibeiensis]MCP3140984.1 hypothetical protein [Pyxidicoccus xibeiensis]
MKHLRPALVGLLTLAYPVLVYFGLGRFEPRWMALPLVGIAVLRALATREKVWLAAAGGAFVLAAATLFGNHALPLKLYPVLVNTLLLTVFATSLAFPPSVIERLARLREPALPPSGVAYTRKVTQVWCGFFVLNGGIALGTALWGSDATWALYNGLIAYGLMGLLFAGEWVVRQRVRASHSHG